MQRTLSLNYLILVIIASGFLISRIAPTEHETALTNTRYMIYKKRYFAPYILMERRPTKDTVLIASIYRMGRTQRSFYLVDNHGNLFTIDKTKEQLSVSPLPRNSLQHLHLHPPWLFMELFARRETAQEWEKIKTLSIMLFLGVMLMKTFKFRS